jgi:hypothetical protein
MMDFSEILTLESILEFYNQDFGIIYFHLIVPFSRSIIKKAEELMASNYKSWKDQDNLIVSQIFRWPDSDNEMKLYNMH